MVRADGRVIQIETRLDLLWRVSLAPDRVGESKEASGTQQSAARQGRRDCNELLGANTQVMRQKISTPAKAAPSTATTTLTANPHLAA